MTTTKFSVAKLASLAVPAFTALVLTLPTSCHKDGGGDKNAEGKADQASAGKGEHAEGKGKGSHGRGGPVAVRVAQVERKVAPRVITADAPLSGRVQADIFSKVLGRITYIGPKEGQAVKAGEILFRVDRSDPGDSFLNAPVQSPISGWVGRWQVTNIGEQVTPNDPVVTVVDDQALRSIVYLPANDWLEVRPETKVTVIVDNQERIAKVLTVARAADLVSGRGSVTIELPNPQRDWRAGMYARVRFELNPKERMLISSSSLIITDQGAYVYIADGEQARRVPVKFQVIDGDTVEITSGLEPKSRVVTAGANLLGDMSPIKVVD